MHNRLLISTQALYPKSLTSCSVNTHYLLWVRMTEKQTNEHNFTDLVEGIMKRRTFIMRYYSHFSPAFILKLF
jgi:hypothetical protein